MSGFFFVPIVRVRNVGFLAIVRNVVCTNCRGAHKTLRSLKIDNEYDIPCINRNTFNLKSSSNVSSFNK